MARRQLTQTIVFMAGTPERRRGGVGRGSDGEPGSYEPAEIAIGTQQRQRLSPVGCPADRTPPRAVTSSVHLRNWLPALLVLVTAILLASSPARACTGCKQPTLEKLAKSAEQIVAGTVSSANK